MEQQLFIEASWFSSENIRQLLAFWEQSIRSERLATEQNENVNEN